MPTPNIPMRQEEHRSWSPSNRIRVAGISTAGALVVMAGISASLWGVMRQTGVTIPISRPRSATAKPVETLSLAAQKTHHETTQAQQSLESSEEKFETKIKFDRKTGQIKIIMHDISYKILERVDPMVRPYVDLQSDSEGLHAFVYAPGSETPIKASVQASVAAELEQFLQTERPDRHKRKIPYTLCGISGEYEVTMKKEEVLPVSTTLASIHDIISTNP